MFWVPKYGFLDLHLLVVSTGTVFGPVSCLEQNQVTASDQDQDQEAGTELGAVWRQQETLSCAFNRSRCELSWRCQVTGLGHRDHHAGSSRPSLPPPPFPPALACSALLPAPHASITSCSPVAASLCLHVALAQIQDFILKPGFKHTGEVFSSSAIVSKRS